MEKGEIFKLKEEYRDLYDKRCYNHPFVFWEDRHDSFNGIMLTTSNKRKFRNIKMKPEYFEVCDSSGARNKVIYGKNEDKPNSYFAPLYLLKDVKYEHLEKAGQLTASGIGFIESLITHLTHTDWMAYKGYTIKG